MSANPARLSGVPMRWEDIGQLGPLIRETDRRDCVAHDCNPELALLDAFTAGRAWTALWNLDVGEPQPLGCFGWTHTGFIWSLWVDLTREQSLALMSRAQSVIKGMAREAGAAGIASLCNTVRTDNLLTIAWLRASKCFDFPRPAIEHDGHRYLPFFVKPLGDL